MPTASYQLSRSEVLATAFWRRIRRREFIVYELGVLVAALLLWYAGGQYQFLAFVFAGIFVVMPIFTLIALRRSIVGIPLFTAETTLSFDSTGIQLSAPGFKSEVAWTSYCHFSESAKYFFLHLGETAATTIPKRAFTPGNADLFRTYAKA